MAADCPWWAPPVLAVQFLTRLPVPGTQGLSPGVVATGLVRAVGWFPLVGLLVGAITAAVAVSAASVWPVYVAVPLALAVEALVTGAFHEDAVADFCDGFGGGRKAEDVRRIMRDSRIGSYGSVGLILGVGLRAASTIAVLSRLSPGAAALAIVAAATFGRLVVVMVMATVSPASGDGLAKDIALGAGWRTLTFAALAAAPAIVPLLLADPARVLAGVGGALVFVAWFRRLLLRRIGGSTGDCLGFAAYAGQLILLLAFAAR